MEQKSVGKVCACNDLGRHDVPGPARPRFSGHLRASACICHLREMVVCNFYTPIMASYTAYHHRGIDS